MTRGRCHNSAENEARMQRAIAEYTKKQETSGTASIRTIAREFNVPRSTLHDRLGGKSARNQAHEESMHLTKVEEMELVHWITKLTQRGYAPRHRTIRELAEIIRNERTRGINDDDIQLVNYDPIGKDWVVRFLSRHPVLESARRKCIEAARIKDVSVERLVKWFEDLRRVIEEHNIEPKNIYNMDESGFAIGDVEASQRIINVTIRQRFQAKPGRQEWVTAIECICADGSFLPPFVIFKGENLSQQWIPADTHKDWRFACNTKGWTSNEHGGRWLREVFEPWTREKANGNPRLLICDGHDSHITSLWVSHCMRNNIIFMVLPPHSSHLTQPLDVGVFGPLKTHMASAIEPTISTEIHRLLKAEWLAAYAEAHNNAFSARNIRSGFCGTGILPFNPSKVINRVEIPLHDEVVVRGSTPIECTTPFKDSVLTSSPLNTDEVRFANAALLSELASGGALSSPARKYAQKVVKRSERVQARNIIVEEAHNKLAAVMTKRKAILSGKRRVIDGEHVLTTEPILNGLIEAEKATKKRKTMGGKRKKTQATEVVEDSSDEVEVSQDESSGMLDCIVVQL